jgi:hypothetical protein
MKIKVDGKEHTLGRPLAEVTYAKVVTMAGYEPTRVLSVVYRKGRPEKPEGILAPGQSVRPAEGMTFRVADTSNA